MTPREVNELAVALMERHGLRGWTFRLDSARRRRGFCQYAPRVISVSKHLLALGVEDVTNTLLHEIAHALVGVQPGGEHHNAVWRRTAVSIGCTGERCGRTMDVPHAWSATCPDCNRTARRHRLTERVKHRACCPCRPWAADRVLTWGKV